MALNNVEFPFFFFRTPSLLHSEGTKYKQNKKVKARHQESEGFKSLVFVTFH